MINIIIIYFKYFIFNQYIKKNEKDFSANELTDRQTNKTILVGKKLKLFQTSLKF